MPAKWFKWALFFLCVTFILGTTLRSIQAFGIQLPFRNFVHAHSHIGFLGWFTFLIYGFSEKYLIKELNPFARKTFNFSFYTILASCFGMLFSFPIEGYSFISITFSTLHIFACYSLSIIILKNLNPSFKPNIKRLIQFIFGFQFIATMGVWALGPIMTSELKETHWYQNSIYFYLHFLYHGFIWSFLIFILLKKKGAFFGSTTKIHVGGMWLIISSHFLTLFLSFSWMQIPYIFNFLSALGSILFLLGISISSVDKNLKWRKIPKITLRLFHAKGLMMLLGSFPAFSFWASNSHPLLITYFHFTFLLVLSYPFLILLEMESKAENQNRRAFPILSGGMIFLMFLGIHSGIYSSNAYHIFLMIFGIAITIWLISFTIRIFSIL